MKKYFISIFLFIIILPYPNIGKKGSNVLSYDFKNINQQLFKCKTDWENENLKEKVKSIEEISYNASYKFGKIHIDSKSYSNKISFNQNGYITEKRNYNKYDKIDYVLINVFDDYGNKILGHFNDSNNFLTGWNIYKYNDSENSVEVSRHTSLKKDLQVSPDEFFKNEIVGTLYNKRKYFYDDNTNVVREEYYGSDNKLMEIIKSEYNANGQVIKRKYISQSVFYVTYVYDENGNNIEQNTYDGNGNLTGKTITNYDLNGDILASNKYNSDGDLENCFLNDVTKEYDISGNWIIYVSPASKYLSMHVEKRTIEYY